MKSIRDLLVGKGNEICSVTPGATVYDAVKVLAGKKYRRTGGNGGRQPRRDRVGA